MSFLETDVIEAIFKDIGKIITGTVWFSFKMINVFLWVLAGVFILPCVFIAGNVYPKWEEWAKMLKK